MVTALTELRFAGLAWLIAPLVHASLHVAGVRATRSSIERSTAVLPRLRGDRVSVARGEALVAAVYRVHWIRGQCLPRSLVQYALHRWHRQDVTWKIGVRPPRGEALDAHAWVEAPGDDRSGDFEPLAQAR